jgi:hypothetical protein
MSIKLSNLLAGLKSAVIDAHRSVSEQHIEELKHYFVAKNNPEQNFPDGEWDAKTVTVIIPKEVSKNGVVTLENHNVMVPLITLLPLNSYMIDKVEILTTIDLSMENLSEDVINGQNDLPQNVMINLGGNGLNPAEIKIVIQASNSIPDGYARLISAYDKILNAQLPN